MTKIHNIYRNCTNKYLQIDTYLEYLNFVFLNNFYVILITIHILYKLYFMYNFTMTSYD